MTLSISYIGPPTVVDHAFWRLEYLRDGRGIYGLSIGDLSYIVRPDRLGDPNKMTSFVRWPALHPIPRIPVFKHSLERFLSDNLVECIHARAGLHPPEGRDDQWWADNRHRFFGQRHLADCIVNGMVGKLLESAADPVALKIARRFPLKDRGTIYEVTALSSRALQIAQTFPTLAAEIYCAGEKNFRAAAHLVEQGTPLNDIADAIGLPIALRKIKPGAVRNVWLCEDIFKARPDLLHAYLPTTLPAQRRWLRALYLAREYGPPFIEWTARNAIHLEGRTQEATACQIQNITDWVRACYQASVPDYVWRVVSGNPIGREPCRCASEFVTSPFSSDMSLRTVLRLSDEWHEAVADHMDTSDTRPFPPPWCDGAKIIDFEIAPITKAADLYREGKEMRNCVGTYAEAVRAGERYIYSVTENGNKVATAELINNDGHAKLGQVRGPCNAGASKKVAAALRRWLRTTNTMQLPQRPQRELPISELCDLHDEIPF